MARQHFLLSGMAGQHAGQQWRLCLGFLCLGLLNLSTVHYADCFCSSAESEALLAVKSANPTSELSSWLQGSDCCSGWTGVTCEASGTHVIAVDVSLSYGEISEDICNLHEVQVLNINLGGPVALVYATQIPPCFWNLTEMRSLTVTVASYFVSYTIPAQFCTLKHFVHLDISNGSVTEMVPDCVWEMTQWEYLDLGAVTVSESFPSLVCTLSNLTHLGVGLYEYSQIVGIPACIGKLARLDYLSLFGFDQFPIPSETCSLVNLRDLRFSALQDGLPGCLWTMTNLEHLEIDIGVGNSSFHLPSDLCNLKNLSYFAFSHLSAQRVIPACLWNMTGLEGLEISFPGIFSSQICNLQNLRLLQLSAGDFDGPPPACIWNMTLLEHLALFGLDLRNMEMPKLMSTPSLNLLALGSTNFNQSFLDGIGNLTALQYLDISGNSITSLPDGMQNLLHLTLLEAHNNFITVIPTWIGRLQNLNFLDLSFNAINTLDAAPSSLQFPQSGETFSGLSNLTELQTLWLDVNRIVDFPLMKNLSQLLDISVSNNNISGDLSVLIPNSIHDLAQLLTLDLSNNNIFGNLSCFSEVSLQLNSLDLSGNQLSGSLPDSLFSRSYIRGVSLPILPTYMNLSRNQLSGRVPELYGNIWQLDLSWNHFEGPLPNFSASTVISLGLSRNRFIGFIPSGLTTSTSTLQVLDFSFNTFSGTIPSFLGDMEQLQVLDLTSNQFDGPLPSELGDCKSLRHLRLQDNHFSGQLPSSICKVANSLLSFTISNNDMEGRIPSSLGNCTSLLVADLSQNKFNGSLPSTVENLSSSLRVFSVASNRLDGPFPAWIVSGNFTSLQFLDISNNQFHGDLPADYSKLLGFISGTNADNNATLYEDGVEISVSGVILVVAYFVTLRTYVDVSSNQLSGHIPEELGKLLALRYFNFSRNNFSGSIPMELSNLQELESLDLSENSLTGGIPSELNEIPQLSYFNVSDNFLTGPIPAGGQFNTFSEDSFRNNSGLCSVSGIPLPTCPSPSTEAPQPVHHRQKPSSWISLSAFFVGFGSSFGAVAMTFVVSKRARGLLFVPHRKMKLRFDHKKPYGAYIPR